MPDSRTSSPAETEAVRVRLAAWLALAFAAATLPRLLTHEMWRDEAWQWLVVRESHSLSELFDGQSRGGGSGYLAPLLYFLARQVSTSPRTMQVVHLMMATAAIYAFARWAPLPRRERLLFAFGYFPFFEYAVISRSYALGALLLWLACAGAGTRRPALAVGGALGLLCQTTVYGYILAIAVAAGWLLDLWLRRRQPAAPRPSSEAAAGLVLAVAGAVAGIVQLVQAPQTRTAHFDFSWSPVRALAAARGPWRAFVPLPRPGLHFWNSGVLDAWPWLEAALGAVALVLACALLWRSRVALVTFAVGAAGLITISYTFVGGSMRHHGHLWLLFFASCWLGGAAALGGARSWRRRVVLMLLVLQLAPAALASWMDLRHPFSNGLATAALIRRGGLDRHPLLGHREPPAASVSLYLGSPLYSPTRRAFVTHPDWGPLQREIGDPELRCAARTLAHQEGRDVVMVINRELPPWGELDPAGAVTGAIVDTEDYHLYRLHLARLATTAGEAACP